VVQKLKTYLTDSKITQAEFATSIGVSQPTVSDWINGETRPSIDNLIIIARLTRLSLDELLSDFDEATA
jgi:transcriptional regulator with XRE-family HTH domain